MPTTIEAGYPDSDYVFWNGMLVPAKTPRDIVDRLHRETQKVLQLPAVQGKAQAPGHRPHAAHARRIADALITAKEIAKQHRDREGGGAEVQLIAQDTRAKNTGNAGAGLIIIPPLAGGAQQRRLEPEWGRPQWGSPHDRFGLTPHSASPAERLRKRGQPSARRGVE